MSTQSRMNLCLIVTKISTLVDLREDYPIVFRSQGQGQSTGLHHCPLNILWSICLIITKQGTVASTREWIIHYIYATLLNFAPGGIYVSQTFLVLHKSGTSQLYEM